MSKPKVVLEIDMKLAAKMLLEKLRYTYYNPKQIEYDRNPVSMELKLVLPENLGGTKLMLLDTESVE